MGALRSFFVGWVRTAPIFCFLGEIMRNNKIRQLTQGAMVAALYVVLTYGQNILFPETANMAIQFRAAEALCVLALFTPGAIWGLGVGCLLFNLSYAGALPLDFVIGPLASVLAAVAMWYTRKIKFFDYPLPAMCMPALFNGLFVGWELQLYIGGGFWFNAGCVALGELGVLLTLGTALYFALGRVRFISEW